MTGKNTYYSYGKLLLTGEYAVLQGALALAIPTRFGQNLVVEPLDKPEIHWKSYDFNGKCWFDERFLFPPETMYYNNPLSKTLQNIILKARELNPEFLSGLNGFNVSTHLEFPKNWGLGSSSTLINNIAQWAQVNPYELLNNTLGGSGYDIAAAQHKHPIIYQLKDRKPKVYEVPFNPVFKEQLYFIFLNKKQKSSVEISRYNRQKKITISEINSISTITRSLLQTNTLNEFEKLLKEHERLTGKLIHKEPIQKLLFNDYFGQIKSLGAWGGDFILATGNDDTPQYFNKKGYNTVLLYDEMLLNK